MQQIYLANTGRSTSRLGYGCSSLIGAVDRKQSLALLEVAYDHGIRHFDVAPMYGYGEAETCLGEFARGHRAEITIATKFGLLPARSQPWMRSMRRIAGQVLRHLPAVKQRLAPASDAIAGGGERVSFDVNTARLSLEHSLRSLHCEHIDLYLLHEAEAVDLTDNALLRFLEDAQASGKIGTFGIGSEASKVPQLVSERPDYCPVLQFEWNLLDAQLPPASSFRIHHRSLSTRFRALGEALKSDAEVRKLWSTEVGLDLGEGETLAALMLKASLEMNPSSIILFSAKVAAKIARNVQTAEDDALAEPALRLRYLLRSPASLRLLDPQVALR